MNYTVFLLHSDIELIKRAIGIKISMIVMCLGLVISSVVIAFIYSWKLALVGLALVPLMIINLVLLVMVSCWD